MARLQSILAAPWSAGARVQATLSAPWAAGVRLQSLGSPYTPPNTGTPVDDGDQKSTFDIKSRTRYETLHTLSVIDLRTGDPIDIDSVSMSLDDGSAFWQLSASAPYATLQTLASGEQPAQVEVSINAQKWRFVVETRNAPRGFASSKGSFGGRSIAALADIPYQFNQQWINDAPTSAAQFTTLAQTNTRLDVDWRADDWLVPEGTWSITGSPWGVVQQAANAIGAVVSAHKTDFNVRVTSRYPTMPNLWNSAAPDVQIAWLAVESETINIIDQPAIDGVVVSGQVGGSAFVRLAGTSGSNQAPMISDPLLTDAPGFIERGRITLASAGGGLMVSRTMQILAGTDEPGVVERGALVRWVDPDDTWVGMVRSISVTADFESARQTIGCERRTKFVKGSIAPPPLPPSDPYYGQTALLLPFDTNFDDLSVNALTPNSVVSATISADASKLVFGAGCADFTANGNARIRFNANSALRIVGAFTIQFRWRPSAAQAGTYFFGLTNNVSHVWFCTNGSGKIECYCLGTQITSTVTAVAGVAYYLEISRDANDFLSFYVDSNRQGGSVVNAANMATDPFCEIGSTPSLAGPGAGGVCYIDELRILTGVAHHSITTPIVVPPKPFPTFA